MAGNCAQTFTLVSGRGVGNGEGHGVSWGDKTKK